jgi:hypothetical protein
VLFGRYYRVDTIKAEKTGGHVALLGKKRNPYKVLIRKPARKRTPGRRRY